MTDNTHTPGPWEVVRHQSRIAVRSVLRERNVVTTGVSVASSQRPQAEADARLVSAAPDLLDALEAVINTRPVSILLGPEADAWEAARAAIAKARGAA